MKLSKKNQKLIFSLVVLLFWIIFVPKELDLEKPNENQKQVEQKLEQTLEKSKVIRIVDGDTIEIESGQKVRYIGIDTPETVDPRRSPECFGKQASQYNQQLVEGKEIYLEKDVSETDKYGRLLRYIYLQPEDISINEQLVKDGYAVASSYPPDVKYQEKFKLAEEEARNNKRGLWQDNLACE